MLGAIFRDEYEKRLDIFDRHLISIDENYRLIVSKAFVERSDSPYSIKQFEGKTILLPANRDHYPSQEKLQKHRANLL